MWEGFTTTLCQSLTSANKRVLLWVEGQVTGDCKGSGQLGRGNEAVGCWVGVVTCCKVPVDGKKQKGSVTTCCAFPQASHTSHSHKTYQRMLNVRFVQKEVQGLAPIAGSQNIIRIRGTWLNARSCCVTRCLPTKIFRAAQSHTVVGGIHTFVWGFAAKQHK